MVEKKTSERSPDVADGGVFLAGGAVPGNGCLIGHADHPTRPNQHWLVSGFSESCYSKSSIGTFVARVELNDQIRCDVCSPWLLGESVARANGRWSGVAPESASGVRALINAFNPETTCPAFQWIAEWMIDGMRWHFLSYGPGIPGGVAISRGEQLDFLVSSLTCDSHQPNGL